MFQQLELCRPGWRKDGEANRRDGSWMGDTVRGRAIEMLRLSALTEERDKQGRIRIERGAS